MALVPPIIVDTGHDSTDDVWNVTGKPREAVWWDILVHIRGTCAFNWLPDRLYTSHRYNVETEIRLNPRYFPSGLPQMLTMQLSSVHVGDEDPPEQSDSILKAVGVTGLRALDPSVGCPDAPYTTSDGAQVAADELGWVMYQAGDLMFQVARSSYGQSKPFHRLKLVVYENSVEEPLFVILSRPFSPYARKSDKLKLTFRELTLKRVKPLNCPITPLRMDHPDPRRANPSSRRRKKPKKSVVSSRPRRRRRPVTPPTPPPSDDYSPPTPLPMPIRRRPPRVSSRRKKGDRWDDADTEFVPSEDEDPTYLLPTGNSAPEAVPAPSHSMSLPPGGALDEEIEDEVEDRPSAVRLGKRSRDAFERVTRSSSVLAAEAEEAEAEAAAQSDFANPLPPLKRARLDLPETILENLTVNGMPPEAAGTLGEISDLLESFDDPSMVQAILEGASLLKHSADDRPFQFQDGRELTGEDVLEVMGLRQFPHLRRHSGGE